MHRYDVHFERTLNRKTSVEGYVPITAEKREEAEEQFLEMIPDETDSVEIKEMSEDEQEDESEDSVEREEESEDEQEDESEDPVVTTVHYERVVYREAVVEGKAPVKASSAEEARKHFREQLRNATIPNDTYCGELDAAFEITNVRRSE